MNADLERVIALQRLDSAAIEESTEISLVFRDAVFLGSTQSFRAPTDTDAW